MKRRIYYRRILFILLLLNILTFASLYIKYCKDQLPSSIHIKQGKETCLQYDVPATATINHQTIKLNQPFVFKESQTGQYEMEASLFGKIPLKKIEVSVVKEENVIPSGKVVGVYIETDGLLVLDTDTFAGIDGANHAPSSQKLYQGDYIMAVNGKTIPSKADFMKMVNESDGEELALTVKRNGEKIQIKVKPIMAAADHQYKIGAWVRDNTQGIGTLTYTSNENFGGLGHGICDMDTGELMDIKGGYLISANVDTIAKGKTGSPGEIVGSIYYKEENLMGSIEKNTEVGIYGSCNPSNQEEYEIGYRQDIKKGKAYIISDVSGETKKYEIKIRKVNQDSTSKTKGMEIEITDKELLKLTNGIVQGMSGTPIVQDGKFIGAITHVFVSDPSRGYAILAETMIHEMEK